MGDMCSTHGGNEKHKKFVEGTQAKRLVKTCRRGWEDNIKVDIRKIEHKDVDWIELTRHVSTDSIFDMVINTLFP
jgi:hypothetical protein